MASGSDGERAKDPSLAGVERDARGDERDLAATQRDEAGRRRDLAGAARDVDSVTRDETGDRRDRAADERDRAAEALDRAAAAGRSLGGFDQVREHAAADRSDAARDRRAGARDRSTSEGNRTTSLHDREAAEAERTVSERDRLDGHTDRVAAANDRAAAAIDELTGARSRGSGLIELEREIARAERTTEPLTLVYVDVDHLKRINDTHGHAAGDDALVGIVDAIRSVLRRYDLVVRMGGDEFLCVLAGLDEAGALTLVARATDVLAANGRASATFGIAQMSAGESAADLIARADADLHGRRRHRSDPDSH